MAKNYGVPPKSCPIFDPKTATKQNFLLPSSVVYYIKKNPATAQIYLTLITLCKYFYSSTDAVPVFDVSYIWYRENKWDAKLYCIEKSVKIKNLPNNLWIAYELSIVSELIDSLFSTIFKNVYRWDVKELNVYYQTITVDELKLLNTKSLQIFNWRHSLIKHSNGDILSVEEILDHLSGIKYFCYEMLPSANHTVTAETANKCIEYIQQQHLIHFGILGFPQIFDFETFLVFINEHSEIWFQLSYSSQSDEKRKKLNELSLSYIKKYRSKQKDFKKYKHAYSLL